MDKNKKIYLAGHTGLAGSAILRHLRNKGCRNVIVRTRQQLDLMSQHDTTSFLKQHRPQVVILAAAKVGGINANRTQPATFIGENLIIQDNVINGAYKAGVPSLIFLGSSCIYPRDCAQPIKEEYLLTGPLESTNRPYAISKIAGLELCWAYNRQFGTRYISLMPTNLYGYGDNYDLENSHVLPALIRKVHEAKVAGDHSLKVWGTGTAKREFLFADDFARAVILLMEQLVEGRLDLFNDSSPPIMNVGSGEEVTICELLQIICETIGYKGDIAWDSEKPDGTPRKLLDSQLLFSHGWLPEIPLATGIELSYREYLTKL